MGRASRRKREERLRQGAASEIMPEPRARGFGNNKVAGAPVRESLPPRSYSLAAPMAPAPRFRHAGSVQVRPPRGGRLGSVYRFFEEYEHAQAFLKGDIWISTLEVCRKYENAAQGDAGEGTLHHEVVGTITLNEHSNPAELRAAYAVGFHVSGGAHLTITDTKGSQRIHDALVLCTTERYDPDTLSADFGKYCVEITDPRGFFRLVSIALWERYDIGFCHLDRISYVGRKFRNFEFPEVHPGFLKPTQGYENQQEVRMLWAINGASKLAPGLISLPEVAQYCRVPQHPHY